MMNLSKFKLGSLLSLLFLLASVAGCGGGSGDNTGSNDNSTTGTTSPASTSTTSSSGKWLTAYYPSYQQFTMPPSEINYASMTHLVHWPVLPKPDGGLDTVSIDFTEAHSKDVVTRAHAAGIKVLLGIGGDANSGATKGFQGATSPANRATFIKNIVNMMQARGYDGVDINWEEIGVADDAQFIALIQELRVALDGINPRPLLTMPPTTGADARPELVAKVAQQLDQINLQTYVMSGPYPGWVTWHNSPLFNGGFDFPSAPGEKLPSIEEEIAIWEKAGIPLNRMGLGIQFAGFVWSGGSGTDTGGATKPRQSWTTAPTLTVIDYTEVTKLIAAGYQKEVDTVAKVPYLTRDSGNNADDRFVSYEDEQSIQEKANFLKAKGLGGMFIFELTGDYFPGAADLHPLLSAAKQSVLK